MMDPVAVFCLGSSGAAKAGALADEFDLPLFESAAACKTSKERLRFLCQHLPAQPALAFIVDTDVLNLAFIENGAVLSISAGFHGASLDYRREKGGGRSEMIAKAVGLKGGKQPSIIDATAGLGVDAFVLASLGCQVTMIERVPAVNALLRDGLARSVHYAAEHDNDLAEILDRMQLVHANAEGHLNQIEEMQRPDVVYLDPMFPERKKSAAVKKEMQIFHKLIGPDEDVDRVLNSALVVARNRVVVKRPRIAPVLEGAEPSYVLEGKRNRYDVYLTTLI